MTKDMAYPESEAAGCGVPLKMSKAAGGQFETAIAKYIGESRV
jgi:hypothetical protein